jgi:hypothetical protein
MCDRDFRIILACVLEEQSNRPQSQSLRYVGEDDTTK